MYLARNQAGPRRYHYVLRESYADGDLFRSRDLADLGPDPGTLFVYTGETSFHVDEAFVRRLGELGVTASYTELEDLLFPFLDPYLKARLQPFRDRHRYRGWRPAGAALRRRALEETHAVDRRRLHFLRLGRTSAETVDKTAALYTVLLDNAGLSFDVDPADVAEEAIPVVDASRSAKVFAQLSGNLDETMPSDAPGWIVARYEQLVSKCPAPTAAPATTETAPAATAN